MKQIILVFAMLLAWAFPMKAQDVASTPRAVAGPLPAIASRVKSVTPALSKLGFSSGGAIFLMSVTLRSRRTVANYF